MYWDFEPFILCISSWLYSFNKKDAHNNSETRIRGNSRNYHGNYILSGCTRQIDEKNLWISRLKTIKRKKIFPFLVTAVCLVSWRTSYYASRILRSIKLFFHYVINLRMYTYFCEFLILAFFFSCSENLNGTCFTSTTIFSSGSGQCYYCCFHSSFFITFLSSLSSHIKNTNSRSPFTFDFLALLHPFIFCFHYLSSLIVSPSNYFNLTFNNAFFQKVD